MQYVTNLWCFNYEVELQEFQQLLWSGYWLFPCAIFSRSVSQ